MRLGSRRRSAPVLTDRGRLFRGVGFAILIELVVICVIVFCSRGSGAPDSLAVGNTSQSYRSQVGNQSHREHRFYARPSWLSLETIMSKGGETHATAGELYKEIIE